MNKKQMAGAALAASLVGAGVTAPIAGGGFVGGLIHNGFLAASIGGLADWFAVTALFRKPLGISYRTEILTRNRQRIMQAVVDFAGNDLLNVDNIMKFIQQRNVSNMLVEYLRGPERKRLLKSLNSIIGETLAGIDAKKLSASIVMVLTSSLQEATLDNVAKRVCRNMANTGTAERLLPFLLEIARKVISSEEIGVILRNNISEVLKKYEGNGAGRAFVMGMAGLDADSLYGTLRNKLEGYIDRLDNWDVVDGLEKLAELDENSQREAAADAEFYRNAVVFVTEQLEKLADSEKVIMSVSDLMNKMAEPEKLQIMLENWLENQITQERAHWQEHILGLAERKINEFIRNDEWQQLADNYLKSWLRQQLVDNHHVITGMVEERLNQLSDEALVQFVEPKVSDDLQMIRINGSVVGGLAGMALYIVTYVAGQVLTR